MRPADIWTLEGHEIASLAKALAEAQTSGRSLRITVQDGLMVKVGEGVWSAPMGERSDVPPRYFARKTSAGAYIVADSRTGATLKACRDEAEAFERIARLEAADRRKANHDARTSQARKDRQDGIPELRNLDAPRPPRFYARQASDGMYQIIDSTNQRYVKSYVTWTNAMADLERRNILDQERS